MLVAFVFAVLSRRVEIERECNKESEKLQISLWRPEKGSHITFVWPFVHFLTLPAALAAKLLFQFKSDLEFKCVSHLGLHLGRPNFPRQPPTF